MMQNNSPFVKFVIWFMIFLMSIGFAALVIAPFLGGTSLFGGGGTGATEQQLEDARKEVRDNKCAEDGRKFTDKQADTCRDALVSVAQAYRTLATPDADDTDYPKGYKQNLRRGLDAYRDAYLIDPTNAETAQDYAGYLQDLAGLGIETTGTADAIKVLEPLVKANPKDEDLLKNLANAQANSSAYDEAIASYTLFIKRFPNSGQVQTIKDTITQLKDAQKQQAEQAAQQSALSTSTTTG